MNAENNPSEWVRIANLDLSAAHHLFNTHHPKPLEIKLLQCNPTLPK
jgi:hypothetical protein